MRRHLIPRLFLLLVFISHPALSYKTKNGKSQTSGYTPARSEAGFNIPEWGLAIDASFDTRLTDLIPGYHIVNIVVTNRRAEPIYLDPHLDRWFITSQQNKKIKAKNHIALFAPEIWNTLPEELRQKLDYPRFVKPGNYVTIDVFIPKKYDITDFKEVRWKSASLAHEFSIFTNYEKHLNIYDDRQNPIDIARPTAPLPTEKERSKWEKQEDEKQKENEKINFDPSFDDAIIIR